MAYVAFCLTRLQQKTLEQKIKVLAFDLKIREKKVDGQGLLSPVPLKIRKKQSAQAVQKLAKTCYLKDIQLSFVHQMQKKYQSNMLLRIKGKVSFTADLDLDIFCFLKKLSSCFPGTIVIEELKIDKYPVQFDNITQSSLKTNLSFQWSYLQKKRFFPQKKRS